MQVYVIHYGEIALKGKNRDYFEKKLIQNIENTLRGFGEIKVLRKSGRLLIEGLNPRDDSLLEFIPGIKNFSHAIKVAPDLEVIKQQALKMAVEGKEGSFRIETRRMNKTFPLTSVQINSIVGEEVVKKTKRPVSLNYPELTIYIELCEKEAYIYKEKKKGAGGLPVGTSGKVISLISGGIDSPVAAFLMMKRGCEILPVHFFNETLHSSQVRKKIEFLCKALTKVQGKIKLSMIPFGNLQRKIIGFVPSRYRMLIYRRTMMKIADKIARAEKAEALVTGDSLAQVASQTTPNLRIIYNASSLPVLAPLIGFDKEETVALARKIGTYDISIMPYEDCCSFMVAKHPETRGRIEIVEELEKNLTLDLEGAIKEAEVIHFNSNIKKG